MNLLRVFPRRTTATPSDGLAFIGNPPMFWPAADEVHVSVTFSWDRAEGKRLADAWTAAGLPVTLGGPAYDAPGENFMPGRYLKPGYTITSRGCPNHCWFCAVPKREGGLRELAIIDGWIVQDDNLLACSEAHIRAVFAMLKRQPHRAELRGLEAKQLRGWHVDLLTDLAPRLVYFAYDTPDDLEPLRQAGAMLAEAGFSVGRSHGICAYVLIGYPGDTFSTAEARLRETWAAGFFPFAMLHRNQRGDTRPDWARFQRLWTRPQVVASKLAAVTP